MVDDKQPTIDPDALRQAVVAIFQAAGSSPREAELISTHLVEANLAGHDSHGVGVIPLYVRNALAGDMVLNQTLSTTLDAGGIIICDGRLGAGQVMAHDAMCLGIARAQETGSCIMGLRDSHHIGRIGHWAEQCAAAGLVSVHFVNVVFTPMVAPFGGTEARLGTNPFAAGFPGSGGKAPVIVDFATSQLAAGKVRVAYEKGERIPAGVLMDNVGNPTTDPAALFSSPPGCLLPFGGHKGGGLALACELLAGAVTGASVQNGPAKSPSVVNSMFSIIVDPQRLGTGTHYAEGFDDLLSWVSSQSRETAQGIRLPGAPERETKAQRLRDGVPLSAVTRALIEDAARQAGLDGFRLS